MSLQWFFLESVAALGVVLFLVNFALLVNWRRRGKPRPLLVGLVMQMDGAAAAQVRFLMWAFVKLGVAAAMLAAAARVVPDLSWPALLVAMVVCLKVYAWALLWQRRVKKNA